MRFRRPAALMSVLVAAIAVSGAGASSTSDFGNATVAAHGRTSLNPRAAVAPLRSFAPTRNTANSATFQDSASEDPAAPDITTIVVSNDNARVLTFQVNIPNRPTLTPDMLLSAFVDTDANPATGDPTSFGSVSRESAMELDVVPLSKEVLLCS